jgi:signal transduction histidine kinase
MINRNSTRLEGFVQQILSLSKSGAQITNQWGEFSLDSLVKDVVALFPKHADRIRLEGGETRVNGMEEGLRHALTNLLANAVNYAPSGSIVVRWNDEPPFLGLSIQDQGIGISPEDLQKLFTPFQRGKSAPGKGTGLGLVIAKRWVEAHGGRIWAESAGLGKGSTFFVQLPKNR